MKKILLLPLMAILALAVSCSGEDDGPNYPLLKNEVFYGKLMLDGSLISDDVKCELGIVEDAATVTIYGVSFAPSMPAMDIVIPAIKCTRSGDNCFISGTDVIPLVNGVPVEMYKMTKVEGMLAGDKFNVDAVTAMGTISFSNSLQSIAPAESGKTYAGNLAVGGFEKSVVVDVKVDQVAGSLDLVLNDVKFAANMPLTLDITLKEIPYLVNDGALSFSATNVAPCINAENEPVAAYTFAFVNGVIEGDRLLLDAKMAEDLAAYVAGMEFAFEGTEVDK